MNEIRGLFVMLREPISMHAAQDVVSAIRARVPEVGDVAFDREAMPDLTLRQEQALVSRVGAFLEDFGEAAHENEEYGAAMPKRLKLGLGLRSNEMSELARDLLGQLGLIGVPEMPWWMDCRICNLQATCDNVHIFKTSFRMLRAEHLGHDGFVEYSQGRIVR